MSKISWKLTLLLGVVVAAFVIFGAIYATDKEAKKSMEIHAPHKEGGHHHTEKGHEHAEEVHEKKGYEYHSDERHVVKEQEEKGHHQEEGEESGKKLSPTETYDQVHKGVRLVLAFHNASSSFLGSVENVTDKTVKAVRVEVHLSNGTELGPTEPMDLAPGEKAGIKLEALGQVFTWWKAHAETGSDEHGSSR